MNETKINFEKLVTEAILANKIVYVEKHNDIILFAKDFNTKEELINWYKTEAAEYTEARYLSAEEAYVEACNKAYIDFLQDFEPKYYLDIEEKIELTPFQLQEQLISLMTYEEIAKDVNKEDYVEGIYDYQGLLLPINLPKSSKIERIENVSYNRFDDTKEVKVTLEIY